MGKGGGGGGQPTQSTNYTTNLPEYAQPYVMNMLGAAQNQLFNTTPGTNGAPGEITGFKPYSPYSSNPTDYFAGPSSLQTSAYNAAGQLQSPSQYQTGSQLAGMSGMGQLGTANQAGMYGGLGAALGAAGAMQAMPAFGAGQQYSNQVTNPNAVGAYMSPYQQQVTDIAKADAMRNAQITEQGNRLSAARQGTYGGARQALASLEREKSLNANLANIQAQGSQSAYDRAIQNMQYGSNLGLQGIQTGLQGVQAGMQGIGQGLQGVGAQQAGYAGANQAASTLGQLGSSQNATDVQNIGLQNQLGGQQQQYQQGIINQQIQDYATAQQYPYMQLSTMSNLLRGLPMQGMSTQQYQAQPSALQQGVGLLGAGASLYGGFGRKEGGTIKEYAAGGTIRGLENKIDDIGDAGGAKGLQALLAKTNSPGAKELVMARMREEGIAGGNTGKLGTNMAGGGIIAFEEGGDVEEEMSELDKIRANNESIKKGFGELFKLSNYDPLQQGFKAYKNYVYDPLNRMAGQSPEEQAVGFRKSSDARDNKRGMFSSSSSEKNKDDRDLASARVEADVRKRTEVAKANQDSSKFKFDTGAADREDAALGLAMAANNAGNSSTLKGDNKDKGKDTTGNDAIAGTSDGRGATGIEAILAENRRLAGIDEGPGAKSAAFMKMLEDQEAGKAGARESDRYLRAAQAFAKFGSTAGPIGATAAEAIGGFAKDEAAARKEQAKMDIEGAKLQAEAERIQRLESMGLVKEARAAQDKLDDRKKDYAVATMQLNKPGEFDKMMAAFKENPAEFEKFRKALSSNDETGRLNAMTKADAILNTDMRPGGYVALSSSKKPEDQQKAATMRTNLIAEYMAALGNTQTTSAGGGNRLKFDASGKQV